MKPRFSAIAAALLLFVGCHEARTTLGEALGIGDKAAPQPVAIDVLCDPSAGSTCSQRELRQVLTGCLRLASARPGSIVRLWVQGTDVTTTRIVGQVVSVSSKRTGKRARLHFEQRWIELSVNALIGNARGLLERKHRRSPIAESITRVALDAPLPGRPRSIIVIGDSLEVSSFGDFECGRLPKPNRFLRDLQRHDVLKPHLLNGIKVEFCFADLKPIDRNRCAMTLERAASVRQLWQAAITAAGARTLAIGSGGPHSIEKNLEEPTQ